MQKILHTPPHTQLRYDFFIVPLYAERCVIGIIKNGNLFRQGCRLHSEIGWVERRPPLESKMFAQSLWCKMPVFQKVAMREGGGPLPLWPSPPGTFHILIGKFSYFVIRFLLNSSIVKSDNEKGKVNDKKKYD